MKYLFYVLIPALLCGQTIDSLKVNLANPQGSGVQGVQQGYSKVLIETAIKDLTFDPVFTYVNSTHFKVTKITTGYEIQVNVEKLKKDDGFYSKLKFGIKSPKFMTYNIDFAALPGRSYKFVVNPANPQLFAQVDKNLLRLVEQVRTYLDNGLVGKAKEQLDKAKRDYPNSPNVRAIELLYEFKTSRNESRAVKDIYSFFIVNPNFEDALGKEIKGIATRIENKLLENAYEKFDVQDFNGARSELDKYFAVASEYFETFTQAKQLEMKVNEEVDIRTSGRTKTTLVRVPISPRGMDVFMDGKKMILNREPDDKNPNIEYISFNYEFKVFNKTEPVQMKWSIVDPNDDYEPLSYMEFQDGSKEWFVSYTTPLEKEISQLMVLEEQSSSIGWWLLGGAVVGGGAYYALTQLDTKTNDVGGQTGGILSDPPKPNITQENGFKLGFKFGF